MITRTDPMITNNSEQTANSVVETTDLQKADSEADSIRQLQLTSGVFLMMTRSCQAKIHL